MKKLIIFLISLLPICPFVHAQTLFITTIAGNGTKGYTGDGIPATSCELFYDGGLFVRNADYNSVGNIYIADDSNARVRMISPAGVITTVAGNGTIGFSGDGGPATNAQLNLPWTVTGDKHGNIYFVDENNHVIRKINTLGIISTCAGTPGIAGFSGDGGPATAAYLDHPVGITVDRFGNLYIGDVLNYVIRKVSALGIITTVAGSPYFSGFGGDGGPATAALLSLPYGIAVDTTGNLYIADATNNRIRKVNTSGIISTIAGNGTIGYTGDGGPAIAAELYRPMSVVIDPQQNVLFCDVNNNSVRKINASGIITTIAGNGTAGFSGDGGPATMAQLYVPKSLCVDAEGSVYIADEFNFRIRKLYNVYTTAAPAAPPVADISIFPNPTTGAFKLRSQTIIENATIQVYNMLGEKVYNTILEGQQVEINIKQPAGTYILCVETKDTVYRQTLSIVNE